MRQGQNNSKRSRGRGRKPQNSGNRAYDSNGPDVKIRGTAAHVCEKYQQLARDAISAGDRVMAENYYQHAEHYYRLLMASQVVNEGQMRPQHNLGYRPDEDQEEDEEDFGQEQPQPNFPNQPYHQQQQPSFAPRHNGDGRGERHHQQPSPQHAPRQGQAPNQGQPAMDGGEGGEEGAPVALDGQANAGAPGEGPRRRPGRRRRQRHDASGGENRHEPAEAGEAGGDRMDAAPSSDEAPAA